MKFDYLVLGAAGMQGHIVCRDLLEHGASVLMTDLVDRNTEALRAKYPGKTAFEVLDIRHVPLAEALMRKSGARVVVNCAEGDWNLQAYEAALGAGCHILDLGSEIPATHVQIGMHDRFREKGLTALTGCGSTPGVNNIMLHYAIHRDFDTIHEVEAGFVWDSNIKQFVVPFSIISVVEELTDPAPYIHEGVWKTAEPRGTRIRRTFRDIGEQTIFLVRHPETFTFEHYYKRDGLKTVRYYAGFPDHCLDALDTFIACGLADRKERLLAGKSVKPLDLLSEMLRVVTYPPGYTEHENLWVTVEGMKDGAPKRVLMECIVPPIAGWEEAGCNVDTGMPASIMAQMVFDGRVSERGSFEPGVAVPAEPFFAELKNRGMQVYENGAAV